MTMKPRRRMTTLLLSAALILLVWGTAAAQTAYDIAVTLDPEALSLSGTQTVVYVNETGEPVNAIVFLLIANWGAEENPYVADALEDAPYDWGFDPTWTQIAAVRDAAGEDLGYRLESAEPHLQTYSLEDAFLVVDLPSPLAAGARFEMQIDFETKFAAGRLADTCATQDVFVWRFGWNPVALPDPAVRNTFALPSASYRVELTVPEDYAAFGGADRQSLLAQVDPDDDTDLEAAVFSTILLESDHVVRSVPLFIGKDLASVSSVWNGVSLEAVYRPGGETFARLALTYAAEILTAYAEQYGPYTGERIVLAENPTAGFFGMAADGMVLAGASFAALQNMPALGMYDRVAEYLLAHELAHLWWGIGIGTDFDSENWISEGFAEYLSISYFEDKFGAFEPNLFSHLRPGLVEDVMAEVVGTFNLRQHLSEAPYLDLIKLGFDEPIVQPLRDVDYLNGLTVRTYNKGYLVLRALEAMIGRDRMVEILREANADWTGRTLAVSAFRAIVEAHAGTDLRPGFFEDWLYGDGQIDVSIDGFEVEETETGYRTTLELRWSGSDLPATIELTLADGSTERFTWISSETVGPVSLSPDETLSPVVAVAIDPDEMLPDTNRFNNHWPRKILVEHPFQDEDVEPAGRPLDAYVIQVSISSVSGFFRNDHQWSLAVMPHIDDGLDFEALELEEFALTWDVIGLFAANVNRNLSILAQGALTAFDVETCSGEIDLRATANVRLFEHPETGNAGTYWHPTNQLAFSAGLIGDLAQPIPYLNAAAVSSGYPARVSQQVAALTLGRSEAGAFATADLSTSGRLRILPQTYLDLQAALSERLFGELPKPFAFSLDRLHAFDNLPQGVRQAAATAELVLPPLVRDANYALLNLTRIDTIGASLFVQGGRTWMENRPISDPGIRLEAGAKLTIQVYGLFGAPMAVSFGYAHPLIGPATEGVPFVGVGSGF